MRHAFVSGRSVFTKLVLTVLFVASLSVVLSVPAAGSDTEESDTTKFEWSDTSRDVYVDGDLVLDVFTLWLDSEDEDRRMAVLGESLGRAYVIDMKTKEVGELPLADFELHATGARSSARAGPVAVGRVTAVRDRRSMYHVVSAGERTIVISPHQGSAGPILLEELLEAAPSWRRRVSEYEPSSEAVEALRALDRDTEVTVVLGTWCGDSRNYVPKLLRSVEAAGNPHIQLDLVSIHRGFNEPADFIRGQQVTNVPTVIVRQAGEEIGRIVETPAAERIEQDLAAILNGKQEPHPGRWERQDEIARGRYIYRDDDNQQLGDESWELFHTEDGGRLLHSVVERDGREVEIWHRRDSAGASEFVEMTRRHEEELSRTRIWINDGKLRALTRGNVTGIVEQSLEVPPGTSFMLPCAADAGFDWLRLGESVSQASVSRFLLPADQPTAGKVIELQAASTGRESFATDRGEVSALRLETQYDGRTNHWWLDDEVGVPIRGAIAGLGNVSLEEFTLAN